ESMNEDVFCEISEEYYKTNEGNDHFSAAEHVLNNLPETLDLNYIVEEKNKLKKQLFVVSKKVSDIILQNQKSYAEELQRVTELQSCLSDTIKVCTKGRQKFDVVKKSLTYSRLGIIASYNRREVLKSLLNSLQTIKTLQKTDIRLRELIEDDENYSGAIQLCLECQKVVNSLKHYKCVSELSAKLQDTLEMTEEQIDGTLSKICTAFNSETYSKLQTAYKLLGKTQPSMDQLLMHFATAIHDKAFGIVLGYVELCASKESGNFQKKSYNELSQYVTSECFIPCLTSLNKALWDIMLNYKRVLYWHSCHENSPEEETVNGVEESNEEDVEASFNKKFVRQKLDHGLGRIWQEVQQKLKILFKNHDLSVYNFDEFILILKTARKMIDIGIEFCGSKSEELEETLHKQTVNYFRHYHQIRMEELKMFLENESWEICPIKSTFNLKHLQEFKFLKEVKKLSKSVTTPFSSPQREFAFYFTKEILSNTSISQTPFDAPFQTNGSVDSEEIYETKNNTVDSDDDIPEELKQEIIEEDENTEKSSSINNDDLPAETEGDIVTTTTLNVLRLIGKYMQIMCILHPIAFDVLLCIFHLFDYYFYAVYKFFGEDMTRISESYVSKKLKLALSRIQNNLIMDANTEIQDSNMKFTSPSLSPTVHLSSKEKLYGLPERAIGVESLIFLAKQFTDLRNHLESVIPLPKRPFLEQYFDQTVAIASDLRATVYMYVAVKSIDYEQILSSMSAIRWDVKEIMSQHNPYVDLLLRELQIFSLRMKDSCKQKSLTLPAEAKNILWEHVLKLANRTFVEGFAQAKKCTPEGRALMQLDYQQFLTKVEGMTSIKPIPEKELVEEYIKAYYLTEAALEQWIKNRNEYTTKQLTSLINCVTVDNKKGRNRLLSMIDVGAMSQPTPIN
ncbi:syndetin-like protein, partial [Dinothrombium tinctorium]